MYIQSTLDSTLIIVRCLLDADSGTADTDSRNIRNIINRIKHIQTNTEYVQSMGNRIFITGY